MAEAVAWVDAGSGGEGAIYGPSHHPGSLDFETFTSSLDIPLPSPCRILDVIFFFPPEELKAENRDAS